MSKIPSDEDIKPITGIKFKVASVEEIKKNYNTELTKEQEHFKSLYNTCKPMIGTKVSDILKDSPEPNIFEIWKQTNPQNLEWWNKTCNPKFKRKSLNVFEKKK
jgi:hypothetical protein